MLIKLVFYELKSAKIVRREYDHEIDDVRSVLTDICQGLEGCGQFLVSGFGQDVWPVDIDSDLPVFLEQLPEVIDRIRLKQVAQLDFYEQGVERTMVFSPKENVCLIHCQSRTDWQPRAEPEIIGLVELIQMLESCRKEFLRTVKIAAPMLAKHPWLLSWGEANSPQHGP